MTDAAPSVPTLAAHCRTAVQRIAEALNASQEQLAEQADDAERGVVQLRDGVIERLRASTAADARAHWRKALDRINQALSLLVSVKYPAGPVQRQRLEQAHDVLRQVLDDGLL